ncbi:MAG: glycosyltransferase [Roseinatronobacter sp.]
MRLQAIVVVRFSYVAEAGFQLSRGGIDQVRRTLYAPDRLERRFRLFEALALPSLLAQTDPDFTLAVLIGADFPPDARARLARLIAPLRAARLIALPPENNFKATKQVIETCLAPAATHVLSIRLDDDDALGRDVIAAHKALAPPLAALGRLGSPAASASAQPVAICFNNGLFLELGAAGNTLYQVVEKLPISVGTGFLAPRDARPTVFSTDHRRLHTRWNCYTEARTPRFIRTVHRDNDSGAIISGERIDLAPAQIDCVLAEHFAHEQAALLALRV